MLTGVRVCWSIQHLKPGEYAVLWINDVVHYMIVVDRAFNKEKQQDEVCFVVDTSENIRTNYTEHVYPRGRVVLPAKE